ncbi:flagellar protein FlaG [Paenibacillus sp. CGMCC 1.16610]|uniref:Flagellar biosynthesis protein FlaG n=1 Tax=Paenibacillus anseongense TaxID=2682845 RepID=A0ABW9U328_9BACL|nr:MULTISPECIES: flagellar protein FlaG [Paenibacillus]MBA2942404.1 flagellar protein FlaG [Paenibacillus sp. CGMCC 1.16610]MVQ34479.1 flagellar biosynthesis protein FlaG [Paenibacillus anseongense]
MDFSVNGKDYAGSMTSPSTESGFARNQNNIATTENKIDQPVGEKGEIKSVGEEQLNKIINKAIKAAQGVNTQLEISVHKETNDLIVKVINKDTGDVIREIPSEKMIEMIQKFMEMSGVLIDQRV